MEINQRHNATEPNLSFSIRAKLHRVILHKTVFLSHTISNNVIMDTRMLFFANNKQNCEQDEKRSRRIVFNVSFLVLHTWGKNANMVVI